MEVYFMFGTPNSGRRQILSDLIEGGFEAEESIVVAESRQEAEGDEARPPLSDRARTEIQPFSKLEDLAPPDGADALFIMADALTDPAESIESLQAFLRRQGLQLTRILTVVDCELAEREPRLAAWFDCCIHFADAVLLNRRENVAPKWLREFEKRYRDLHYPCLFENVKKGRVRNPALILDPTARRATLIFDDIDAIDQLEIDPDNLPDEPIDLKAPADPWLERHPSGQRVRPIPKL